MLFDLTVSQTIHILGNLASCLDKGVAYAELKKFDPEVLLHSRLAPDQFDLLRQVQIACDTAKLGVSRLTGKQAPSHADDEKTLAEARTRIQETIAFLKTVTEADFAEAEQRRVAQPRWEGKWLTGREYALHHMIPNFYFHVTTAYAILRHNGVDVGKRDYLGPMPFRT